MVFASLRPIWWLIVWLLGLVFVMVLLIDLLGLLLCCRFVFVADFVFIRCCGFDLRFTFSWVLLLLGLCCVFGVFWVLFVWICC